MLLANCALLLAACSDSDEVMEQRDWDTTTFFSSSDEQQSLTYYKPMSGYVGDPMPMYDPVEQNFKVMYLQDYRPNPTATYHPIWCVATDDGGSYVSLGEIIPCGGSEEQDAALGTGSTVYDTANKRYVAFYTGNKYLPTSSDDGQVVMMATSTDFTTWTKNRTFRLRGSDYGYSGSDFRDPCLFQTDDGTWHMLVSTMQGSKGVLAEFTSTDLDSWTHQGVFMSMMWDRFYECPDVFRMGDWWYLVYSEIHAAVRKVQYFKGTTLDELKACTADDAGLWPDSHEGFLDSRGMYAGKTASDGTNRYLWAWCPTRSGEDNTAVGAYPDEPEWAGNMVCHRILQHSDGTLTLGEVPAIASKYQTHADAAVKSTSGSVSSDGSTYTLSGESSMLLSRLGRHNRLSFTLSTSSSTDKFGVSLVRGSDSTKYYSMIVNPESDTQRKVNFEEEGSEGMGFIDGIDGYLFDTPADNTYNITIYTDNSVVVMYINDVCSYTNRIYGLALNPWSINSYSGDITVSNIEVREY